MNKRLFLPKSKIVFLLFFNILMSLSSCSFLDEADEDCPEGCHIRFIYDYNMKFADAFSNEVKQVALYVFNENGTFVKVQEDKGDALKESNYFMRLRVDPGKYQLVAWGGLDGESFTPVSLTPGVSTIQDLKVSLNHLNFESNKDLHSLWHGGVVNLTVTGQYQEQVIDLTKDTHRVRVTLQNINGGAISDTAFRFEIIDDNSLMSYDNTLIPNKEITYRPYVTGQNSIDDTITKVFNSYAELHTGRIMADGKSRLKIFKVEDNSVVVDIPLAAYLTMVTEMESHKKEMTPQEYLDRQDEYSFVFFLDDNLSWMKIQIIVNGWTVRFNDTEF